MGPTQHREAKSTSSFPPDNVTLRWQNRDGVTFNVSFEYHEFVEQMSKLLAPYLGQTDGSAGFFPDVTHPGMLPEHRNKFVNFLVLETAINLHPDT